MLYLKDSYKKEFEAIVKEVNNVCNKKYIFYSLVHRTISRASLIKKGAVINICSQTNREYSMFGIFQKN